MKKVISILVLVTMIAICAAGCSQADRVTHNLQVAADNFNVYRRVSVLNMRTDTPVLTCTGLLSISNDTTNELVLTIKTGPDTYKIDYIYLNEYTMYTVEDITGSQVSPYQYEINFLPQMIPPISIVSEGADNGIASQQPSGGSADGAGAGNAN